MTKNKTLYRLTWVALLTLIVVAATMGSAEGSQYTAQLGDTKNYGGKRDTYATRVMSVPGIYEFSYQINVIDADSLTSWNTTQIQCYLEMDGNPRRTFLLGYSVMARSDKATPDQQGVGAISGTLRAHVHEYAIMYCDTSNEYGVTVLVSRLYKRFLR